MTTRKRFLILISSLLMFASCNGQTEVKKEIYNSNKTQMDNYELTPETAHPKSKKIMTEEFYWSPIEESGPFGNDDGSDAFYGFRLWRMENKNISPLKYLDELFARWNYPKFDFSEIDTLKISEYISKKEQVDNSEINDQLPMMMEQLKKMSTDAGKEFDENQFKEMMSNISSNMGETYLRGQDNGIIAVGFGQFVLEGKIDEDIKSLTKTAINRQLLPILIDNWDGEYKQIRIEQLNKMLEIIDKMNN